MNWEVPNWVKNRNASPNAGKDEVSQDTNAGSLSLVGKSATFAGEETRPIRNRFGNWSTKNQKRRVIDETEAEDEPALKISPNEVALSVYKVAHLSRKISIRWDTAGAIKNPKAQIGSASRGNSKIFGEVVSRASCKTVPEEMEFHRWNKTPKFHRFLSYTEPP